MSYLCSIELYIWIFFHFSKDSYRLSNLIEIAVHNEFWNLIKVRKSQKEFLLVSIFPQIHTTKKLSQFLPWPLIWANSFLSCSWHQFTNLLSPIHKYFVNEIWCYDYFNDVVKCILMPSQDLEKVGWFQSRKNNE